MYPPLNNGEEDATIEDALMEVRAIMEINIIHRTTWADVVATLVSGTTTDVSKTTISILGTRHSLCQLL